MAVASNIKLIKIAAFGGILTATMGLAYRSKVENNVKQTDHYKEAMKILRAHKAAISLLGEPIKDCRIEITNDNKNYTKALDSHYEVPVKGPKQRGVMHFWASRKSMNDKFVVDRVELELKNEKDKRLLIKSEQNNNYT